MTRFNRWIPLAVIAMSALALAAQDTVTLRRQLTDGTTEKYKIESTVKQSVEVPGMGEQNIDITTVMTYALKIGKTDAATGLASVETVSKLEKMSMEGMPGGGGSPDLPEEAKKEMVVPGKLDVRNRLKIENANIPTGPAAMLSGGSSATQTVGIFFEFPEGPIKIGDSWDVVIPKGPLMYKEDQKLKATLVGEKDADGVKAWVIKMEGTLKMEPDMEAMMKANAAQAGGGQMPNMKMTGTMEMSTEGLVDKATGVTIRMLTKYKMSNEMELVDQGMKLDLKGSGTTKVTRG
ncbi:MAG: hypothetical protein ACOYON_06530 [Fimbriimonas sp.]